MLRGQNDKQIVDFEHLDAHRRIKPPKGKEGTGGGVAIVLS